MAPKTELPSCGFAVGGTKKGELPLKTEKRARGKKVTIIPNVTGDATKLLRTLTSMLGIGGTVRQSPDRSFTVEVQGDQIERVTTALLDFGCLKGLTTTAMAALKKERQHEGKGDLVVARNAATTFLAQTQDGKQKSPAAERRRHLELEAEFYGRHWANTCTDDFSDIWDDSLTDEARAERRLNEGPAQTLTVEQLNMELLILGMLSTEGRAIKEHWNSSGLTLAQFRKNALKLGGRDILDTPDRKKEASNLKSRQKVSDHRAGAPARGRYFSCTCSVIDAYEKGQAPVKQNAGSVAVVTEPTVKVSTDGDGWCTAAFSYVVPFKVPPSRLDEDERIATSKGALRAIQAEMDGDLQALKEKVSGVDGMLDCSTFCVDLHVYEREFLHAARVDSGKAPDRDENEELKLVKKLRDIFALREKLQQGEKLDKKQVEKVSSKDDIFREVAEMKLKRAEKILLKMFKRKSLIDRFESSFWELEEKALFGSSSRGGQTPDAMGIFDEDACDGPLSISEDGFLAESRAPRWVGVRLKLDIRSGEVGAFALEVLKGELRLGWSAPSGSVSNLGSDPFSFGFECSGAKVTNQNRELYGQSFTVGDQVHCEAERENGQLRIGYAINNEPLGVAYDVPDFSGSPVPLSGVVCGKNFKARLLSAECMPLDEAPGLDNFQVFDPPRLAQVIQDVDECEGCLKLRKGEVINASSTDGEGWLFGFFLDPEDPDDGGWFPINSVMFLDGEATNDDKSTNISNAIDEADWDTPSISTGYLHEAHEHNSLDENSTAFPQDDRSWNDAAWDAPLVVTEASWDVEVEESVGAACSSETGLNHVDLTHWLESISLLKYEEQAAHWCSEMGAVSMEEIEENWEDFAEALNLKPLERKRLAKKVGALSSTR